MDQPSLYDEDIYAWAEQQAAALRSLAASRPDLPNVLDLENIAEEIGDVGKSELHATTSLLGRALGHLAKLHGDPRSLAVAHWSGEVRRFLIDAKRSYSPGMRRLIDLDEVWRDAVKLAYADLRQHGLEFVYSLPETCPFILDELLTKEFDVEAAVARLHAMSK